MIVDGDLVEHRIIVPEFPERGDTDFRPKEGGDSGDKDSDDELDIDDQSDDDEGGGGSGPR